MEEGSACPDRRLNFIQDKKPNMITHSDQIVGMLLFFMRALAWAEVQPTHRETINELTINFYRQETSDQADSLWDVGWKPKPQIMDRDICVVSL